MRRMRLCLVTLTTLCLLGASANYIGIGSGPVFLGGYHSEDHRTQLGFDIYNQYRRYGKLLGKCLPEDERYHAKFTEKHQCMGACPQYSYCRYGICVCDHSQDVVQVYGRCYSREIAPFIGDREMYRKPIPPPRPEWCFCEKRNGGREVCDQNRMREECWVPSYPNKFDLKTQFCRRADHSHCMSKDINMICGAEGVTDPADGMYKQVCKCRKGMEFDTESMECRILIDVNCTTETRSYSADKTYLARLFRGEEQAPDKEYSKAEATHVFCNMMESVAFEFSGPPRSNNRPKTPVRAQSVDKKTGGKALEGCLNPKGREGESVSEGCIKQTCKKGIWRSALDSTVCCYDGESYAIGSSLPTVLSDDGCGAVDHQCVLDDGQAVLQLHVENRCSGYATQDQARELKSLVEEYLSKKC